MKLISWNVNGIRAVLKKGFSDFLKKEKPDILALQEIKICEKARLKELEIFKTAFNGYDIFWNSAERPGYSGTATLVASSKAPSTLKPRRTSKSYKVHKVFTGVGITEFDKEGRTQTLEFDKFYFVNAYFPNANHELSRLNFKLKFNNALLKYLKKLEQKKPVIICGDFNVAREEIDLARPKDNVGNPGFTDEEREWADKFVKAGFMDTFRQINKNKIQYSWWSYRFGAREKNIGWRIDYFFVSAKLFKYVKKAYILDKITGSDHCPVGIEIKI